MSGWWHRYWLLGLRCTKHGWIELHAAMTRASGGWLWRLWLAEAGEAIATTAAASAKVTKAVVTRRRLAHRLHWRRLIEAAKSIPSTSSSTATKIAKARIIAAR